MTASPSSPTSPSETPSYRCVDVGRRALRGGHRPPRGAPHHARRVARLDPTVGPQGSDSLRWAAWMTSGEAAVASLVKVGELQRPDFRWPVCRDQGTDRRHVPRFDRRGEARRARRRLENSRPECACTPRPRTHAGMTDCLMWICVRKPSIERAVELGRWLVAIGSLRGPPAAPGVVRARSCCTASRRARWRSRRCLRPGRRRGPAVGTRPRSWPG